MRSGARDETGSLPATLYLRLLALVRSEGAGGAELRSLCEQHGSEAVLNALYLACAQGLDGPVRKLLDGLVPADYAVLENFRAADLDDTRELDFVRARLGWYDDKPDYVWGWLLQRKVVMAWWRRQEDNDRRPVEFLPGLGDRKP